MCPCARAMKIWIYYNLCVCSLYFVHVYVTVALGGPICPVGDNLKLNSNFRGHLGFVGG